MRGALAIHESSLGSKHPSTVIGVWNLLLLYMEMGEVDNFEKQLAKMSWLAEAKEEDLVSADLRTIRGYLLQLLKMMENAEKKSTD